LIKAFGDCKFLVFVVKEKEQSTVRDRTIVFIDIEKYSFFIVRKIFVKKKTKKKKYVGA